MPLFELSGQSHLSILLFLSIQSILLLQFFLGILEHLFQADPSLMLAQGGQLAQQPHLALFGQLHRQGQDHQSHQLIPCFQYFQ